jgi:hypothetical protein
MNMKVYPLIGYFLALLVVSFCTSCSLIKPETKVIYRQAPIKRLSSRYEDCIEKVVKNDIVTASDIKLLCDSAHFQQFDIAK